MSSKSQILPRSRAKKSPSIPLRLLLVDDNPLDLQALLNELSNEFEVVFSTTAKEALFYANQEPAPDIILIDVHMPTMDGFQLCEILSLGDNTKHIPKIFISANNRVSTKTKAFNLGCVDYVTKPVNAEELLMRLKIHVKLSQQSQAIEQIPAYNPLTNLYNFSHYVEEFQKEWATCKRYDYPLSMLHIAIDGMDEFTQTYGNLAREKCIQTVANGIRNVGNRPGDIIAHLDDFYFAILLSDSHISYSINAAKEILARIRSLPIIIPGMEEPAFICVSIGVASVYPDDSSDSAVLHRHAQQALEDAQKLGGGTWSMHSEYRSSATNEVG